FTWLDKGANDIDTFSVYTFLKDSTVQFTFNQKDSIKQFTLTTRKGAKKPVFNINTDKKLELTDTIKIQFSTPVISYDTSRLILKEDTNIIQPVFTKLDENGRYIQFYYKWNEKKRYSLEVKDSAFTDIYEQYNKKEK